MKTIEEQVFLSADLYRDKVAFVIGKEKVTYSELKTNILRAKKTYMSLPEYQPRQAILLSATKTSEFIYSYFGAHLANLVVLPLDPRLSSQQLTYVSSSVNAKFAIGFNEVINGVRNFSYSEISEIRRFLTDVSDDIISFPDLDSVADVMFTTGTTGHPKGVKLSYLNEAAAVRNINEYIGNQVADVEMMALPINHSFGLGRIRCCLSKGQTIVFVNSFTNVKHLFRLMHEYHVAGFSMVPAAWQYLKKMSGLKLGEFRDTLRYVEMGSAYLSQDDKSKLAEILPNSRIVMHYGLTEASRSTFMEFHVDSDCLSSVGKPAPHVKISVFNEFGQEMPDGEVGEICICGEHVSKGYINEEYPEYKSSDGKLYFRTGDLGFMNESGYVFLQGRIKEQINVGGKKVNPIEVEEQIIKIEGIKDCAVVGIPDPAGVLGEVVKAFVVLEDGYDPKDFAQISKRLLPHLDYYKIPVAVETLPAIPRTSNGKIQRNLLLQNVH